MTVGKSPGPDGFSMDFYKHHWERVGQDLLDIFVYIFATGDVPLILNATTLSLGVIKRRMATPFKRCTSAEAAGSRMQTIVLFRLASEASLVSFSDGMDKWVWNGSADGRFTQRSLWEEVRSRSGKLSWAKWRWSRSGIPRHEFITWMLFYGKLPTRDSYSAQVWRLVLQKLGEYRGCYVWRSERQWYIDNLGGKSLKRRVIELRKTPRVDNAVDVVGNGGGRMYTVNIPTCTSITAAASNAEVAKLSIFL
ncbi:hypothetical protein LIER_16255 [Lithospermum erythrorhizon]|uniref:Reverse transcriptase zinc-binding domain-containing protein n=1 Tax=Lithospermum erythrorhizon TaxID=34254 RepID=A0AAV3Q7I9_LITER